MDQDQLVACPFCGETNFDLIGLKHHLERGWCDRYNLTPDDDGPRSAKEGE